jgi:hypothetical protein
MRHWDVGGSPAGSSNRAPTSGLFSLPMFRHPIQIGLIWRHCGITREGEAIEAVCRLGGSADQVRFCEFAMAWRSIMSACKGAACRPRCHQSWRARRASTVWPARDRVRISRLVLVSVAVPSSARRRAWAQSHRIAANGPDSCRLAQRQDVQLQCLCRRRCRCETSLAALRSQMERPAGQEDWPVLADIGGGDFLKRLLSDHEMFTRYELNA